MKHWQGWTIWVLAAVAGVGLPGAVWHQTSAPDFPWAALLPMAALLGILGLAAPVIAGLLGPGGARMGMLSLIEAPPDFLWGGLLLALWPSAWGPPGLPAFGAAFLVAALPSEVRWLCAAMPVETPLPLAYGSVAIRRTRRTVILRLMPRWLAARVPLWLTAALILERIFGIQGFGGDWMQRIANRDRLGIALWMLAFALLWRATRIWERQ
ncbi:MAG: hypothetical protein IPQ13_13000 [Holophagaceae bacterium]|nr:hypothetical protein [Holophagaceae bacterium]